MKSTLYRKFIIVYIIFAFLGIFTIASLTSGIVTEPLVARTGRRMYREATLMAGKYFPRYFEEQLDIADIRIQLQGIQVQLDASVWFVDKGGAPIASAHPETMPALISPIPDFNPAETGNSQYITGNYHDFFDENVITVITPVVQNYSPQGYLLIHKTFDEINTTKQILMRSAYITFFAIYLFSFIILLAFQFFIYSPLRKITEAATQYASGNLEYEIPVRTNDEIGYLSASLNYMSSHLRDMEDYQKKFIANVSHDFRSPLTSIRGYIEAIADGTIPQDKQEKYLSIILFETERLTDLTQDLLTLNEYDKANLLLNKEAFDLHEVIKKVAASFEGPCKQKRLSIELLLASKHMPVNADQRRIQQVLYNLLDNAIKFSPDDSTITIETTEKGDKIYTSIKDYGIGIPHGSLNKIWERFYKTDLSRGKDKRGTGLGLAIVKEAIQAHNEIINVVSTEGVGTEFIFTLPKA